MALLEGSSSPRWCVSVVLFEVFATADASHAASTFTKLNKAIPSAYTKLQPSGIRATPAS
jgi:hypothetical protein